mmetsp:Transcript_10793/g.24665  ORF Transcript_10793/g.24665 Transcript_10793/m.24665 type:complete len:928 (+) Transcript_10793:206-2989(+)
MAVAVMFVVGMALGAMLSEGFRWSVQSTRLRALPRAMRERLLSPAWLKLKQQRDSSWLHIRAQFARNPWLNKLAKMPRQIPRGVVTRTDSMDWMSLDEASYTSAILDQHYETFRSCWALLFACLSVLSRQKAAKRRSRRMQKYLEAVRRSQMSRAASFRVLERAPSLQEVRKTLSEMLERQALMLRQQPWAAKFGMELTPQERIAMRRASAPQLPSGVAKGKGKGKTGGNPSSASSSSRPPAMGKSKTLCLGELPFGQRMHWAAQYESSVEGTVFGALPARRERSRTIDPELMQQIFGSKRAAPAEAKKEAKPKQVMKPPPGIVLLAHNRAQNLAITLRSLSCPLVDICKAVTELDFCNEMLVVEDLEVLSTAMLQPDELAKLAEHKDTPEKLRDVERMALPLCQLSPSRLRAVRVIVSHLTTLNLLMQRCDVLKKAAMQTRDSVEFRELLAVILQIGNYINHGQAEIVEGTARGFSIESLHVLASFKRGGVSALHFLCLTMFQETGENFFTDLMASLSHVKEASRENTAGLKADIERFHIDAEFLKKFQKEIDEQAPEHPRVEEIVNSYLEKDEQLRTQLSEALSVCSEVKAFFHVGDKDVLKQAPFEEFCGHIAAFLQQFHSVWRDLEAGKGIAKRVQPRVPRFQAAQAAVVKPSEPAKAPMIRSMTESIEVPELELEQEQEQEAEEEIEAETPTAEQKEDEEEEEEALQQDISPPRGGSQKAQSGHGKGVGGRARAARAGHSQVSSRLRAFKRHAIKRRSALKKQDASEPQTSVWERQLSEPCGEFWGGLQRQISVPEMKASSSSYTSTRLPQASVTPRLCGLAAASPKGSYSPASEDSSVLTDKTDSELHTLRRRLLQDSDDSGEDSDCSISSMNSSNSSELSLGPSQGRKKFDKHSSDLDTTVTPKKGRKPGKFNRILSSGF